MKQNAIVYLASASPRRKDILSQLGIKFQVITSDADETSSITKPDELVMELSRRKAVDVAEKLSDTSNSASSNATADKNAMQGVHACELIIGSDTVVAVEGEILGKPSDKEDALRMIRLLSGRHHEVYTGVTLVFKEGSETRIETFYTVSKVFVMAMSDEEIESYVDLGTCYDKAGAYAIQEEFGKYIERFEGDYYTIIGLPMNELYKKLKENDIILV